MPRHASYSIVPLSVIQPGLRSSGLKMFWCLLISASGSVSLLCHNILWIMTNCFVYIHVFHILMFCHAINPRSVLCVIFSSVGNLTIDKSTLYEFSTVLCALLTVVSSVNLNLWILYFITRRRSWSFAEYCKHFVVRLNDVHTFGYNSAGSEWIWMKFGEFRVYCLELSLTNFGRDPHRSGSGRASRNFVFLSIKRCAISPTSNRPNFTKFAQKDVFPCPLLGL